MSSTNKTTNYQLSQFIGSDKPAWLTDYNGDMNKIDTAIKTVSDVADSKISTVTSSNIEDGAVTATKLAVNSVTSDKIQNSNVTTDKIATSAVSSVKIADDAVTTTKLVDGCVSPSKLNAPNFTLPANNGWEGFIDTQGRKHRYIIKTGEVTSVPQYQSKSVSAFNFPDDMGSYGTDFEVVSICESSDYGESNISFPVTADGSSDIYFSVYNGFSQARATIKYKVYIEIAEL